MKKKKLPDAEALFFTRPPQLSAAEVRALLRPTTLAGGGEITPAARGGEAGERPARTPPAVHAPRALAEGLATPSAMLVFKLPEDRAEFEAACSGMDLACNLSQIDEALRERLKYGNLSVSTRKELEGIRGLIDHSLLERVLF